MKYNRLLQLWGRMALPAIVLVPLLCLIVSCFSASKSGERVSGVAYAAVRRGEIPQEAQEAALFTRAGLTGDRSLIPLMIKTLQGNPYPHVSEAALQALGRLGAVEALPTVDNIVNGKMVDMYGLSDQFIINAARVAKARLVAESEPKGVTISSIQASTKASIFFQTLGISPDEMNVAVANYFQHGPEERNAPAPLGLCAMRELADIAYIGKYTNFSALPEISSVKFYLDYQSEIKVKIAPLSHPARAGYLAKELSKISYIGDNEAFEMRLAISEGYDGSQAAAAQLREMEPNKQKYAREGFAALLDVIGGSGDASQEALLSHFSADPDPFVAAQAKDSRNRLSSVSQ